MSRGRPPVNESLQRSAVMYERLNDRGDELITIEGEPHLSINGTDYRILDNTVTDFNNADKPLVSIGKKLTRELVILDPLSKNLDGLYRKLRERISDMQMKGKKDEIQEVLDETIYFVRWYLKT